jgi:hypothetical protein
VTGRTTPGKDRTCRRALGRTVVNEVDGVEIGEFGQVSMDLTHVSVGKTGRLADASGFALDDRSEEFERLRSGDAVDVRVIVVDDLEVRAGRLATVECREGRFEIRLVPFAESDVKRAITRVVTVTSRGHVRSPRI